MADNDFHSSSVKKHNDDVSMKDIIKIFIPKLWIVAICAVILGIVLGGYAMLFKADTYTSETTFIVSTTSGGITDGDLKLSYKVIDVLEVQILSEDFLDLVAEAVNEEYKGWNVTARELKRAVKIEKISEEAPAFTLSVTTDTAAKSHDIADVLRNYMTIDSEKEDKYNIQRHMHGSYSKVTMTCIDTPTLGVKNDKGVATKAIIGFLAGAVISMVVIYMIAMFDVVIHDRKKLEDNFDIPILGVIPKYDVPQSDTSKGGADK